MFEYQDFKKILDETTDLLEKLKVSSEDEIEEIQMRIDSNVQALKIIASKIEDSSLREQFLKGIESLCNGTSFSNDNNFNISNLKTHLNENENTRNRKNAALSNTDIIDEELLKNTSKLRNMVTNFSESLNSDKKIIDKLSHKMHKHSTENSKNMNILEKNRSSISTSFIMGIVCILFILTYLIIRFF